MKQFTIRIDDNMLLKTKVIADKERRSLNNQFLMMIEKFLTDYEKEYGTIVPPEEE